MSEKHANFIVNDQKGTAADVRALAERVRAEVLERTGTELEFEIVFLGDWGDVVVTARPPVVVLLGGPSAEHDVSIVSGTAIAEALAGAGLDVEQVLIDLDGALVAAAGGPSARGPSARRLRRPRLARRDRAGVRRSRRRPPRRRDAATGRLHRPPRPVRRGRHRPGAPRGRRPRLHGVRRDGVGARDGQGGLQAARPRHRAAGRRLARGPGGSLGARTGPPSWPSSRRSPAARATRGSWSSRRGLGSSVGITLAHGPEEYGPALDEAFRFDNVALAEAYLAGARDLEISVIGNDHARLELFGPGEIVAGHEFYDFAAKYTPGLSETSLRAEVSAGDAGVDAEDRPRCVPGDRRARASPASTSSSAATRSSSRRSTRSRASPRSASSRRCRPRAATRSPTSA